MMRHAYVALGSNQGNSYRILTNAIQQIRESCGRMTDCSHLYRSKAELLTNQPDFYNAVIEIETNDEPIELLRKLKLIEGAYMKSNIRFGPRELDLDIVAYDQSKKPFHLPSTEHLTIPHVRAHQRDFVLKPLCDLKQGKHILLQGGISAGEYLKKSSSTNAIRLANPFAGDRTARTLIMGILNVTPDSFTDGGLYYDYKDAIKRAEVMLDEDVDIIDIGGESTKPHAKYVDVETELDRVIPVIQKIRSMNPDCLISIDTRKSQVARAAIQAGANIINDESGEDSDGSMSAVAAEFGVPIIYMHTRGSPQTMTSLKLPEEIDIVAYVREWLERQTNNALEHYGIPRWNIIGDPGIGFAKTKQQHFALLRRLDELTANSQILVGHSRKGFIRDLAKYDVDVATSAVTSLCVRANVGIVRVHNIKMARDIREVTNAILENQNFCIDTL